MIRLESLEELFKAAEALMKPVLHYSKPGQHTYNVLDDSTLYRYLNQEESSNPPVYPNDDLPTDFSEVPEESSNPPVDPNDDLPTDSSEIPAESSSPPVDPNDDLPTNPSEAPPR